MPSAGTFVLTNCRVLVGGADLSGDTNEATIAAKKVDRDVTNYNSAGWTEHLAGLGTATIAVKGFTEAGTLSLPDDNGMANLGLLGGITLAPRGAADQAIAYTTNVLEHQFDPLVGKVGDVAAFDYAMMSSWPLVRGIIGQPPATLISASGTGTINQLGAVAAGQNIYADVHLISISGAGASITFSIQSAALVGFGSPTTRITFPAQTAIGGAIQRTAGPITDQFWRVAYTVNVAGSFLAAVTFGIA